MAGTRSPPYQSPSWRHRLLLKASVFLGDLVSSGSPDHFDEVVKARSQLCSLGRRALLATDVPSPVLVGHDSRTYERARTHG
jgi:hypothetical protein